MSDKPDIVDNNNDDDKNDAEKTVKDDSTLIVDTKSAASSSKRGRPDDELVFPGDEDNEEEVISISNLNDYIEEENEAIKTSIAVLGTFGDKQCSFNLEKTPHRQAIFSCATCELATDPETGKKYQAGFCYACSVNCHKDHEIYELWTKRTFNCDCGNDRFTTSTCQLFDKKGFLNSSNLYNHNFDGLYCTCNKEPFPPEYANNTAMSRQVQCVICEDWYHLPHINDIRLPNAYEDVFCFSCIKQQPFLVYYFDRTAVLTKSPQQHDTLPVEASPSTATGTVSAEDAPIPAASGCTLEKFKSDYNKKWNCDDILPEHLCSYGTIPNWRKSLCRCENCLKMYEDREIEFLIDEADSIKNYTDQTEKQRQTDLYDQAFSTLSHQQKIGIITLKQKLNRFLVGFLESNPGATMTVDDVKEFVERELKRPRLF